MAIRYQRCISLSGVYYGARWDTGKWRASEPFPDDYAWYPKYPSEWIGQKDADGNEVLIKPKIKTWQLREIRRAAPAFGKCVGRDRSGVWLWVLKKGADGYPLMYSDVREAKTKRNMANKAKREKADLFQHHLLGLTGNPENRYIQLIWELSGESPF